MVRYLPTDVRTTVLDLYFVIPKDYGQTEVTTPPVIQRSLQNPMMQTSGDTTRGAWFYGAGLVG